MRYVVAANFRMFKEYLRMFVDNRNAYKFVDAETFRGVRPDSIVILYENYTENPGWHSIQKALGIFTNIYIVNHVDWI